MNHVQNFTGSLRRILVKYWFSFALVGLVLIAAIRQSLPAKTSSDPSDEAVPTEKRTAPSAADQPTKMTENTAENPPPDESKIFGSGGENETASGKSWTEIDEATRLAFLKRFAKVAVGEQQKFGIPASVILGSALVQSRAGTRDLARSANNFFAMPGPDFPSNGKKYAAFKTAWDSFRANSLVLDRHFPKLKKQGWKTWATELGKADYSDLPDFEKQLAKAISENRLDELDR